LNLTVYTLVTVGEEKQGEKKEEKRKAWREERGEKRQRSGELGK
jgi:hypothetical protein